MIKGAFIKVIVASIIMFSIHILQMFKLSSADSETVKFSEMFFFRSSQMLEDTYRARVGLVQRVNFLAMLLMLNVLSLGFESNHALERGH